MEAEVNRVLKATSAAGVQLKDTEAEGREGRERSGDGAVISDELAVKVGESWERAKRSPQILSRGPSRGSPCATM